MNRQKLYIFLAMGCIAGYVWLVCVGTGGDYTICFFKRMLGIPCPACGSTRAVSELLHGNLMASLHINPNGILLLLMMFIFPVWIVADVLMKADSLYRFYLWIDKKLKYKKVFVTVLFIIILNWTWNIYKGL